MKLFLYGGIRIWTGRHFVRFASRSWRFTLRVDSNSMDASSVWSFVRCTNKLYRSQNRHAFSLTGLSFSLLLIIYSRNALGIPSFNESNVALNFTAFWKGFLPYGFEQSLRMDALEATRSGQINLFRLESDDLHPFDW